MSRLARRNTSREGVMAGEDRGARGVLVQVCLKCGKEYMFDDGESPSDLACGKCGSAVFRSFVGRTRDDDVTADFRESTERDTGTTDPSTDVSQGDLHDLNNP
jgi:DNA-directed RNA polymerase subunit RPC12/RpoP